MLRTHRIHLRLFLQGVECPISRCAVSSSVVNTAQITLLPTPTLPELRPGTQVVVGYYDPDGADPVTLDASGAPYAPSNYSLLFSGYIRSFSEERSATGRSAVLQCEGDLGLLDRFHVYMFNAGHDVMSRQAAFVGASKFVNAQDGTASLGRVMKDAFDIKSAVYTPGFENMRGVGRSVVALMERAMGVTLGADYDTHQAMPEVTKATAELEAPPAAAAAAPVPTDSGHGRYAQHEYFAIVNSQTHLPYQIGALPIDYEAYRVLSGAVSSEIVGDIADQLSAVNTLLTVIRTVVGRFYHGLFSVPTARAVPGTLVSSNPSQIQSIRADLLASSAAAPTLENLLGPIFVINSVAEFTRTARALTGASATLDAYRPHLAVNMLKWLGGAQTRYVEMIREHINNMLLGTVVAKRNSVSVPDEQFNWSGDLTAQERIIYESYVLALIELLARAQVTAARTSSVAPPRILTTLILPDLFFATPPTCNVLFPNQLFSIALTNPCMDRTTRLMLYTDRGELQSQNGEGQDQHAATGVAYYAPSGPIFDQSQGQVKFKQPDALPTLLPHEHHTGIVPGIKNASQLDLIFKGTVAQGADPNDRTKTMMRLANFHLLDERYKGTMLNVAGPFNPYAVPGLPCAVIDTTDINTEPRFYQGLLQSVSHDISSSGAVTSYTISHVRRTTEVDSVFEQIGNAFGLDANVGTEDLFRAFWYGEQYSLANIGKALYQDLVGCGSVQDVVPTAIPTDAVSVDVAAPSVTTPTYRTHTALHTALAPYRVLSDVNARTAYVHSYVRRDVADIIDVIGPRGLYSWQSCPNVTDFAEACPPNHAPAAGTVEKNHPPTVDPAAILRDKRDAAEKYEHSTRKAVFR